MAHATDIVGYTYEAATYCPNCVRLAFQREADAAGQGERFTDWTTEQILDWSAGMLGLDRYDEHTFDSDEFPKVIFRSMVDWDICEGCEQPLD